MSLVFEYCEIQTSKSKPDFRNNSNLRLDTSTYNILSRKTHVLETWRFTLEGMRKTVRKSVRQCHTTEESPNRVWRQSLLEECVVGGLSVSQER